MEIRISFDDALIEQCLRSKREPLFEITWKHQDVYYPFLGWSDYGVVLLGWWTAALQRLDSGTLNERLVFMDGPYHINLRREDSDTITAVPANGNIQWKTSREEVVRELTRASNTTVRKLLEHKADGKYLAALNGYISILRNISPKK